VATVTGRHLIALARSLGADPSGASSYPGRKLGLENATVRSLAKPRSRSVIFVSGGFSLGIDLLLIRPTWRSPGGLVRGFSGSGRGTKLRRGIGRAEAYFRFDNAFRITQSLYTFVLALVVRGGCSREAVTTVTRTSEAPGIARWLLLLVISPMQGARSPGHTLAAGLRLWAFEPLQVPSVCSACKLRQGEQL
jgi:hypothetical protein